MNPILLTLLVALLVMGVIWLANQRWQAKIRRHVDALDQEVEGRKKVDFQEIGSLPEPVQRYFRLVLKHGAAMIRTAKIVQSGGFRTSPKNPSWAPMEAMEFFSTAPKGFVWDADIAMMPLLHAKVCDRFYKGQAGMSVKLSGVIPLVDAKASDKLSEGALQRYLAEAVWFPTALLPSEGVVWEAVDDRSARATLEVDGVRASLLFFFNRFGEVTRIYAPERYKEEKGTFTAYPWEARLGRYERVGQYVIPTEGMVLWHLPEGEYDYWKAEIVQTDYR